MVGPSERWDAWVRERPWLPDAALAVGLALALGATSLAFAAEAAPGPRAALVAALAALHAAVAARRTWPRAAYAVACAAMLVVLLVPDLPGAPGVADADVAAQRVPPVLLPSSLTYAVVLYSAASRTRRPWPSLALASGLVGAALTTARLWQPAAWAGDAITATPWRLLLPGALLAVVLAAWGLGRFRAMRDAAVEALRERALRAEADRAAEAAEADRAAAAERERMAREMHDVVAHSLAVMVRQAEGGRMAARRDPAAAVEALTVVADAGRRALRDMRGLVDALRPPGEPGATAAPQPTADDVPALVEAAQRGGVDVELEVTGRPAALDSAASLAVYRLVQEALTNVVTHAGAGARVRVRLTWGDVVRVEVVDDGGRAPGRPDGGPAPAARTRRGAGLIGMRERVAIAGGSLDAGPRGAGFAVVAELPVSRREATP